MNTIHVDNGPEFHSETFRNACMAHDIRLEYRPVKNHALVDILNV